LKGEASDSFSLSRQKKKKITECNFLKPQKEVSWTVGGESRGNFPISTHSCIPHSSPRQSVTAVAIRLYYRLKDSDGKLLICNSGNGYTAVLLTMKSRKAYSQNVTSSQLVFFPLFTIIRLLQSTNCNLTTRLIRSTRWRSSAPSHTGGVLDRTTVPHLILFNWSIRVRFLQV